MIQEKNEILERSMIEISWSIPDRSNISGVYLL